MLFTLFPVAYILVPLALMDQKWTPTEVMGAIVLVIWGVKTTAVDIIRALKGEPHRDQLNTLAASVQGLEQQITNIAKDALPPAVQQQLLAIATKIPMVTQTTQRTVTTAAPQSQPQSRPGSLIPPTPPEPL